MMHIPGEPYEGMISLSLLTGEIHTSILSQSLWFSQSYQHESPIASGRLVIYGRLWPDQFSDQFSDHNI